MNAAHLHLILVHIPVVLIPTATVLLCVALWRNQPTTTKTALSIFIAATIVCVPAFLLGEDAEEIVEHRPGVVEDTIEEHEEAAELALWLTVATGSISLLALLTRRSFPSLQPATLKTLVVLGTIASGSLSYTAFEGGKIRHPEAYEGQTSAVDDNQERHDHED